MDKPVFSQLFRLWAIQWGVLGTAGLICWWPDKVLAYSLVLGGLVYWLPNAWFALSAFRFQVDKRTLESLSDGDKVDEVRAKQMAALMTQGFFRGEINKFALTAIGFALVFTLASPIHFVGVFVSFIAMTVLQWLIVSRW